MADLRVLIADDEELLLRMISRLFERAGVSKDNQTLVESCAKAIDHYKNDNNYHLVLTDLNQNPSGINVVNLVRANHGGLATRVGIMTGGCYSAELLRQAQDVTDFFLEKPLPPNAIQEVIRCTQIYFQRVGVPSFPKEWYVDKELDPFWIVGVEGVADSLDEVIKKFKIDSSQIDWSPIMPQNGSKPWNLLVGNVYKPGVCNLQVGQNIGERRQYTSVVSVGVGQVVVDLLSQFIQIANFDVRMPLINFVMQTEIDESPLKTMYAENLKRFNSEIAVDLFRGSIRLKQEQYKVPNN